LTCRENRYYSQNEFNIDMKLGLIDEPEAVWNLFKEYNGEVPIGERNELA
jgi:hypothetical protein